MTWLQIFTEQTLATDSERWRAGLQFFAVSSFCLLGVELLIIAFTAYPLMNFYNDTWLLQSCDWLLSNREFLTVEKYSTYILGYLFAIGIGHFAIAPVMDMAWKCTKSLSGADIWQPEIVGFLERALYTVAFTVGGVAYSIIPAWLVFKVAGQWRRTISGKDPGRRLINNNFLIGTLLCLIYAAIGAFFAKNFFNKGDGLFTIIIFGFMLVASSLLTIFLWLYLIGFSQRSRPKNWKQLQTLLREARIRRAIRMAQVRNLLGEPDFVKKNNKGQLIWHYIMLGENRREEKVYFEGSDEFGYRVIDIDQS